MGTSIKIKIIMKKIIKINFSFLTFLLIPLIFLWNPNYFRLMDVQPQWSILWLFPWACVYGPFNGLLAGLSLGIVLDSLYQDPYTQIPGMVICGFLFGKLSKYKSSDINKFKYCLICSYGSLICNCIYFFQIIFYNYENNNILWFAYGIKNVFAQIFVTGLLAPVICNLLFSLFKKNHVRNPSIF
ncbi:MAG: hypothetical protein CMK49_03455 [Prochlorococcus sp. SP3034]|nr:hypothetical protein [Prochlorococcus sp. SP3034]